MAQVAEPGSVVGARPRVRMVSARIVLRAVAWLALAVVAVAIPFVTEGYRTFQFTEVLVFAVIVLGLNLLTGYTGQISLGHGAFVLVGAYAAAMLITGQINDIHLHPILAVLVGGLVAAAVGVLVGIPALRLAGPYLAVVTLGLSISAPIILKSKYLADYTLGAHGILVKKPTPPAGFFERTLFPDEWQYFIVLLPSALLILLAWNLLRSRIGRAFVAVRDSESGAQMAGVNLARYKLAAFGLSAFYAGIGGGMLVLLLGFISPDTFTLFDSINFLTAMVIGGLGTILGSVLGGIFLAFQTEINSRLADVIPHGQDLRWAIYGALLILLMIFAPGGIAGALRRVPPLVGRLRARRSSASGSPGPPSDPPEGRDAREGR